MSHTKEPWFYGSFGRLLIVGNHDGKVDKHYPIADLGEQHFPSDTEEYANARRIVACVNACAGIPTHALEGISFAVTLGEMAEEQEELTKLRAALLDEAAATGEWRRQLVMAQDEITKLRAERDALKADADRYRWLRENLYVEDGCLEMAKNIYCHTAPNKADIDAAIDAAREKDHD